MASLRPVAAAVPIEWSPGVIALTEGVFCIPPPYVGQAGGLWGTLFTSTGKIWSFQFSFFFVEGGKI